MASKSGAKFSIILLALLVVSLLSVLPTPLAALELQVGPTDNIQDAVTAVAAAGGTVYFAPGTYNVNIVIDTPAQSFALIGSGEGVSILDGNGTDSVIKILDSHANTVTIRGFTIQNGDSSGLLGVGGGIHTNNTTLVVSDCTLTGNTTVNGGAMYLQYSAGHVTRCTFTGNTAVDGSGGAIYNWGSSPVITDCTFVGNVADSYAFGGAIYNHNDSSPTITDCIFTGNSTKGSGGAIANNIDSSPTITSCTFTDNDAEFAGAIANRYGSEAVITSCLFEANSAESWGGAIYNLTNPSEDPDQPTISGCTFVGNGDADTRYGGAIANNNSAPQIDGCTFSDNEAEDGGAIYNTGSSPLISGCTFTGNRAGYGAGIRSENNSVLTLTHCVFDSNMATGFGGALYAISNTAVTVRSCTFSDNEAQYGAGMYNNGTTFVSVDRCTFTGNKANYGGAVYFTQATSLTVINSIFYANEADYGGAMDLGHQSRVIVTNCTFTGNEAENVGGAIRNTATRLTVTNCILWDNGEEIFDVASSALVTYSDVQGGWPGAGNIDAEPLFVSVPGDLSLRQASPCVDSGTDASAAQYGSVTDDILGVARPQRTAYDMGAYEYASASWSPVVLQPLARTQLASVLSLWEDLLERLPDEPEDDMAALIAQIQGHVANAAQLTNPIYASGQLSKAAAAMQQLAALLA